VARRWDVAAAASLAGDDHRAARAIARSLHDVADEIGSGMAKHLHARIPELHAPDEQSIYEETEVSTEPVEITGHINGTAPDPHEGRAARAAVRGPGRPHQVRAQLNNPLQRRPGAR